MPRRARAADREGNAVSGADCLCDALTTLGHWLAVAGLAIGAMWIVAIAAALGAVWFLKRLDAGSAKR
jgi:hypothetical protein